MVSDADMTGRSSTASSTAPSNALPMHSCSLVVRASKTPPHLVFASTLTSKSATASVVSEGTVVVLLGIVDVLLGAVVAREVVVVLLGIVVVLLGAVVVDSCVESPPQLAKAMMAARAANVRIQWTRTVKAPKGGIR